jgi:hypothetical protein
MGRHRYHRPGINPPLVPLPMYTCSGPRDYTDKLHSEPHPVHHFTDRPRSIHSFNCGPTVDHSDLNSKPPYSPFFIIVEYTRYLESRHKAYIEPVSSSPLRSTHLESFEAFRQIALTYRRYCPPTRSSHSLLTASHLSKVFQGF